MIKRVVKLSFEPEQVAAFLTIYQQVRPKITALPGCRHLELWQARHTPHILFTYSHWDDEAALNDYRHSELFKNTWAAVKKLFNDRPEAWTVDALPEIPRL